MGAFVGIFLTVLAYHDPDFHPRPAAEPPREIVVIKTVAPSVPPLKRDSADCAKARQLGDRIQFLVIQISSIKGDVKAAVYDANTAIVGRNWKELQNLTVKLRAASSENDPLFIELTDTNLRFKEAVSSCART